MKAITKEEFIERIKEDFGYPVGIAGKDSFYFSSVYRNEGQCFAEIPASFSPTGKPVSIEITVELSEYYVAKNSISRPKPMTDEEYNEYWSGIVKYYAEKVMVYEFLLSESIKSFKGLDQNSLILKEALEGISSKNKRKLKKYKKRLREAEGNLMKSKD